MPVYLRYPLQAFTLPTLYIKLVKCTCVYFLSLLFPFLNNLPSLPPPIHPSSFLPKRSPPLIPPPNPPAPAGKGSEDRPKGREEDQRGKDGGVVSRPHGRPGAGPGSAGMVVGLEDGAGHGKGRSYSRKRRGQTWIPSWVGTVRVGPLPGGPRPYFHAHGVVRRGRPAVGEKLHGPSRLKGSTSRGAHRVLPALLVPVAAAGAIHPRRNPRRQPRQEALSGHYC